MSELKEFAKSVKNNIQKLGESKTCKELSQQWLSATLEYNYCHNFQWMGVPIIQAPQDIVAMQELIWEVKPDLIIETGVARGGSVVFYASMMEMMGIDGNVLGIDIDIRDHNYGVIVRHPMYRRITLIEGSSIAESVVNKVREFAQGKERIMVVLDSNHTHDHVLGELNAYAGLVSVGSYCVVFDSGIEDLPNNPTCNDRPWGKGNNPKTAVHEYLKTTDSFEVAKEIENKLLITACSDGYLRRIK
jgi:cephalosporin hydroxylase